LSDVYAIVKISACCQLFDYETMLMCRVQMKAYCDM